MSVIKEDKLIDEYPSSITIDETRKILDQLENCIFKIFINDGGTATGFFCYIKYKDSNISIPVLFTNNYVLKENDIKPNKTIKISFYEKKVLVFRDIKIGKDRLVFTSEKYDTTIIEIKKEKEIY